MDPYRDRHPTDASPARSRWRRLSSSAGRLIPRPLSLLVVAGALGWPAVFVNHLLRRLAEPLPVAPACSVFTAPVLTEAVAEPAPTPAEESPAPVVLAPRAAQASVARTAHAIVEALDAHDYAGVAGHASREHGLDVLGSTDVVTDAPHFTQAELRDCARDRIRRVWISGEVKTTCAGYFARTLKGQAFATSVRVVFNGDADTNPTARADLRARYASSILVDHRVLDVEDATGDRSDSVLTLVFQPEADAWRLAAIVGP